MNLVDAIPRVLLPRPAPVQTGLLPPNVQLQGSHADSATGTRPRSRQPKTTTRSEQDWEDQRPNITRLFAEQDLPLQDVIQLMDERYHFKASRKQYNTKIQQWHIGKNVRDIEMRAIVRKETQRKMGNPAKNSVFRVRKRLVDAQKIARFKRDKGFEDDDVVMKDAGTPSDISCDTPRPESRALSILDPQTIPEDDANHPLDSTVQPTSPLDSYLSALSPRFKVLLHSPHLCLQALNQPFATNSPDLSQLQEAPHVKHGFSMPAPFHRTLEPLFNSPSHRYDSPLSPIPSTSPHIVSADTKHSLPSLTRSNASIGRPFNTLARSLPHTTEPDLSRLDWFEPFVSSSDPARSLASVSSGSHLGNFLRTFIRRSDTYEARRKQEVVERLWSIIIHDPLFDLTLSDHCQKCRASNAPKLFDIYHYLRTNYPSLFPADMHINLMAQEIREVKLPVLDSNDLSLICIAYAAEWALLQAKRYQGAQRVTNAIFQEIEAIFQEMDGLPVLTRRRIVYLSSFRVMIQKSKFAEQKIDGHFSLITVQLMNGADLSHSLAVKEIPMCHVLISISDHEPVYRCSDHKIY